MSSRWMDHHRPPKKPSRIPRALAAGLACPLAGAAIGWIAGDASSSSGFWDTELYPIVYAVVGGAVGLVVAPIVAFVVFRRAGRRRREANWDDHEGDS